MAGIDAFGTVLKLGDAAGTSFDAIAEVTSVDVLDVEVEDLDVTSHDSASGWREYIGGLKDGGELSFELNFDPAVHAALLTAVGASREFQIVMPAGVDDIIEFEGYIKSLSAAAPHDDKLTASAAIKVSGPVTITVT